MENLLIAIKSDIIRTALVKKLSSYKIHICNTGAKTLEKLEASHPDILIIDLTLPDIDGLTVLQKTRYRPSIILALTNFVSDSVMQAAAAAGVQDIILIPCTIRYIIERLAALMEKSTSLECNPKR